MSIDSAVESLRGKVFYDSPYPVHIYSVSGGLLEGLLDVFPLQVFALCAEEGGV